MGSAASNCMCRCYAPLRETRNSFLVACCITKVNSLILILMTSALNGVEALQFRVYDLVIGIHVGVIRKQFFTIYCHGHKYKLITYSVCFYHFYLRATCICFTINLLGIIGELFLGTAFVRYQRWIWIRTVHSRGSDSPFVTCVYHVMLTSMNQMNNNDND